MATDDTGPADAVDASDGSDARADATGASDGSGGSDGAEARDPARGAADRIEEGAGDVADEFDERLVDLLAWLLDTETKARIFVRLRQRPAATSQEIADGTGLYPSTVREALAELHDEGVVTRTKRESAGAGNNPYEYEAIPPADLVEGAVGRVQSELNTVFNLDRRLGRAGGAETDPVTITLDAPAGDGSADDAGAGTHEGPRADADSDAE